MIARLYDRLIAALAGLACAVVGAVFISIVTDVAIRNADFEPPRWTGSFTEYAMLYVMMLAAPYLVRTRGHATVETLTQLLPRPARRTVETIACAASVAISLVLAYYGLALGIESIERGELDIRSVAVPKWVVFAPLPPCFILTAAEFLRILLRREALTGGDPLAKETL